MSIPNDQDFLSNTKADIRLLGIPNILSSFSQFDSSPRISMVNHHLPQTMVLNNPEFNKIFTGVEKNMIPYSFNSSKRDHDCEILAIIPKYHAALVHNDDCPQFYVITRSLEPGEDKIDYFTVDRYFQGANDFGWIPVLENAHRLTPGAYLEKETLITHSPAIKGNQWCPGLNLNTVYGSFPETIEDAFIISESAAKRLETTQVSQIVINCRQDRRPLNLNGDEFKSKFLPDIGSRVRSDGALCAFRPVHWTTAIADTDPEALREPLPLQDEIIYIEPDAKIVDITFNINKNKLNDCYEQAREYMQNNTKCWEAIYATYSKYKGKLKPTQEMSTLVTTAIYRMIAQGARVPSLENEFAKLTKNFDIEGVNGHMVDFMQVVVTYTVPRKVSNGSKISDLHGSKGVIGKIYPDDAMPVDGYGIRADLWIDMNSPVSRNNPGQLYETGVNRISEFVRREIKSTYEEQGLQAAWGVLLDWYSDVNPNYARRVREVCPTPQDQKPIVEDAIATGPKLWVPPFLETLTPSKEDTWNALSNIKKWADKWGVKSTPIRYKSHQGDGTYKEFITEEHFAIGSKYIIQLHKIPEIFAPGPAAVNHIGIPTKATFETKHFPVTVNPYRFGEDELRVMAMDTDIREVTRFQNLLSNSPTGVIATIQAMLLSEHPSRIQRIPISNGHLYRTSAILNLFHGVTATLGVQTKATNDKVYIEKIQHMVSTSNELAESIWASDIINAKDAPISMSDDEDIISPIRKLSNKKGKVQKLVDLMEEDDVDSPIVEPLEEDLIDPEIG